MTDKDGDSGGNTAVADIAAPNQAPVAQARGPYAGAEGGAIAFSGAGSSDPDGNPLTYDWDFGDGTTGSGVAPSHAYADNGSFTATLTVSDGSLSHSATASVTVSNVAPTATFMNTTPVNEGSPFTLSLVNATDPSSADLLAGLQYSFNCGTGGQTPFGASNSRNCPTTNQGTFNVRGGVRDKNGGTTVYTAQQVVQNVAPTVTVTPVSFSPISAGGSFTINVSFTDPGTGDRPWRVTLNWGNGTQTFNSNTQLGTPVARSRTYAQPGVYTILMTVRDRDGGIGSSIPLQVVVN